MTNNNATILYMNKEDESGYVTTYQFAVKDDWLVDYIGEDEIADFLEEYTSEDTMELYPSAVLDNAIVEDLAEVA
jgi:hypothetical protein